LNVCSERPRQSGQPLEDIARLLAGCGCWQAACLEKEVVRVLVMRVGLTFANLILRDGAELDGLQSLSLEVDIGDHAFPNDRFVEQDVCRRRLKYEIAQ